MVGHLRAALPVVLGAALLAGCNGGGANPRRALQPPNAVSGGTRGGGRPEGPSVERMHQEEALAAEKKAKKTEDAAATRDARAEILWNNAVAARETNPGGAAKAFEKLANDFKESPHAEMARWREAEAKFAVGDWFGAEAAAEQYLTEAPCNCHLAQAERVVYESSVEIIRRTHGFAAIWKSNKRGMDGLRFLVDHMPEGAYSDDALMALGDEHYQKSDWAEAAQSYKELIVRYPESPLRHEAHMKLGDAYLARDQGNAYHAGYVDVDPRSPSSPAYLNSRPIRSTVGAAAAQYQAFLDGIKKDPACAMAADVERAQTMLATSRARLAAKYREAAAYYASHGMQTGAEAYRRYAENVEAGKPWSDDVASVVAPSATPARPVTSVPPQRAAVPPAPPPAPPNAQPPPRGRVVKPPVVVPPQGPPPESPPPPPPPRPPNIVPVPPPPPPEAVATSSSTGASAAPAGDSSAPATGPVAPEGTALPPPRHVSGGGTTR